MVKCESVCEGCVCEHSVGGCEVLKWVRVRWLGEGRVGSESEHVSCTSDDSSPCPAARL